MASGKPGTTDKQLLYECNECGRLFRTYPSQRKGQLAIFCSKACWRIALSLAMKRYLAFKKLEKKYPGLLAELDKAA